jgi:cytidine deaminase
MDNELVRAAVEVRKKAYAPYSKFLVGAAVRDEKGRIHTGCNVENASYPETMCAEQGAIATLIASGGRSITEVAVCGVGIDPVTPCGGCRQKLREFCTAGCLILICDENGTVKLTTTLGTLLPNSFGPEHLGHPA